MRRVDRNGPRSPSVAPRSPSVAPRSPSVADPYRYGLVKATSLSRKGSLHSMDSFGQVKNDGYMKAIEKLPEKKMTRRPSFTEDEYESLLAVEQCRKRLSTVTAESKLLKFSVVETVDLSCNEIEEIPMRIPPSITSLNLSSNLLISTWIEPGALSNLTELILEGNEISTTIGISNAPRLRYVNLNSNMLTAVQDMEMLTELEVLLLRDNHIKSPIGVRSLSVNSSLSLLDVRGNPMGDTSRYSIIVSNYIPSLLQLDEKLLPQRKNPRNESRSSYTKTVNDRNAIMEEKMKQPPLKLKLTSPSPVASLRRKVIDLNASIGEDLTATIKGGSMDGFSSSKRSHSTKERKPRERSKSSERQHAGSSDSSAAVSKKIPSSNSVSSSVLLNTAPVNVRGGQAKAPQAPPPMPQTAPAGASYGNLGDLPLHSRPPKLKLTSSSTSLLSLTELESAAPSGAASPESRVPMLNMAAVGNKAKEDRRVNKMPATNSARAALVASPRLKLKHEDLSARPEFDASPRDINYVETSTGMSFFSPRKEMEVVDRRLYYGNKYEQSLACPVSPRRFNAKSGVNQQDVRFGDGSQYDGHAPKYNELQDEGGLSPRARGEKSELPWNKPPPKNLSIRPNQNKIPIREKKVNKGTIQVPDFHYLLDGKVSFLKKMDRMNGTNFYEPLSPRKPAGPRRRSYLSSGDEASPSAAKGSPVKEAASEDSVEKNTRKSYASATPKDRRKEVGRAGGNAPTPLTVKVNTTHTSLKDAVSDKKEALRGRSPNRSGATSHSSVGTIQNRSRSSSPSTVSTITASSSGLAQSSDRRSVRASNYYSLYGLHFGQNPTANQTAPREKLNMSAMSPTNRAGTKSRLNKTNINQISLNSWHIMPETDGGDVSTVTSTPSMSQQVARLSVPAPRRSKSTPPLPIQKDPSLVDSAKKSAKSIFKPVSNLYEQINYRKLNTLKDSYSKQFEALDVVNGIDDSPVDMDKYMYTPEVNSIDIQEYLEKHYQSIREESAFEAEETHDDAYEVNRVVNEYDDNDDDDDDDDDEDGAGEEGDINIPIQTSEVHIAAHDPAPCPLPSASPPAYSDSPKKEFEAMSIDTDALHHQEQALLKKREELLKRYLIKSNASAGVDIDTPPPPPPVEEDMRLPLDVPEVSPMSLVTQTIEQVPVQVAVDDAQSLPSMDTQTLQERERQLLQQREALLLERLNHQKQLAEMSMRSLGKPHSTRSSMSAKQANMSGEAEKNGLNEHNLKEEQLADAGIPQEFLQDSVGDSDYAKGIRDILFASQMLPAGLTGFGTVPGQEATPRDGDLNTRRGVKFGGIEAAMEKQPDTISRSQKYGPMASRRSSSNQLKTLLNDTTISSFTSMKSDGGYTLNETPVKPAAPDVVGNDENSETTYDLSPRFGNVADLPVDDRATPNVAGVISTRDRVNNVNNVSVTLNTVKAGAVRKTDPIVASSPLRMLWSNGASSHGNEAFNVSSLDGLASGDAEAIPFPTDESMGMNQSNMSAPKLSASYFDETQDHAAETSSVEEAVITPPNSNFVGSPSGVDSPRTALAKVLNGGSTPSLSVKISPPKSIATPASPKGIPPDVDNLDTSADIMTPPDMAVAGSDAFVVDTRPLSTAIESLKERKLQTMRLLQSCRDIMN